MPLAFDSRSHGRIAFGFFNIESDMLLLEPLFFFADQFCAAVGELTRSQDPVTFDAWRIRDPRTIGNLHGAIAGEDLSGFIGATYARHPFPARQDDFKQSPQGQQTQAWIAETIAGFGQPESVLLAWDRDSDQIAVSEYTFELPSFRELITYVDAGGYPRWRDEQRPAYVTEMLDLLRATASPLLRP